MELSGYMRSNGQVGVRNHLAVISSTVCANRVVQGIAAQIPGVVPILHQHGCAQLGVDREQTARILAGMGSNPNAGAVLVVGLGCESLGADLIASEIDKTIKPVEYLVIQKEGGVNKSIQKGSRLAAKLLADLSQVSRQTIYFEDLIIGTECGGSDAASGLTANPATGLVADKVVEKGGTVILSETTELIGAEHLLAKRALNLKIKKRILEIVRRMEEKAVAMGVDIRSGNPTPGNMEGGITTLEEKSLGCIRKGGHSPVMEVLDYGEPPKKKGLVIMDTPGHDIESMVGMAAGGCQVIIFTTGRGTPAGCPLVPVIKVSSTSGCFNNMEDSIDINAGLVLEGKETLAGVAERLYAELEQVVCGKLTKSELMGHFEFAINRIGPTM
ncbi:MAG: UxaA family hydrolase [Bacillota bacterium]